MIVAHKMDETVDHDVFELFSVRHSPLLCVELDFLETEVYLPGNIS